MIVFRGKEAAGSQGIAVAEIDQVGDDQGKVPGQRLDLLKPLQLGPGAKAVDQQQRVGAFAKDAVGKLRVLDLDRSGDAAPADVTLLCQVFDEFQAVAAAGKHLDQHEHKKYWVRSHDGSVFKRR